MLRGLEYMSLLWTLSNRWMFLCWGPRSCNGVSQEQSAGEQSPCWLWFLWCCVGYRWLSGLQALVQAHIELLINQHLLVLLRASLMPSLYLHLGLLQPLQLLLGYRKAEQVVNSLGLGAPTAFSPGSVYGDMSQFLTLWVCSASAISSSMFNCF